MSLPTGTVTFLFTDIEGSTRRWEQDPQKMSAVLARHDALMRAAITGAAGSVFKTVGDAFCSVFDRPQEAVRASLVAQQALDDPSASDLQNLRVRMAIHTGTADERDGDYFGPAVNRVARLLSIGHGGQVLVSDAAQKLVSSSLPDGCALRDMGTHRLKDLAQPEHVFQLLHAGLPDGFPALRSLDGSPNSLPRQLSTFVGRESELLKLRELLSQSPLLTLTGAAGSGKTRLAIHAAQTLMEQFSDGVWFAELSRVSDALVVPSTIAAGAQVREQPGRPVLDTLVEHFSRRTALLVIDGCEHLLEPASDAVSKILVACPKLRVLATSREALGVQGETVYRVPSLALPPTDVSTADAALLCESVRLFVERAQSAKPQFAFTDAMAPTVARICRRLDGIPLPIELAAARVKVLSVDQILARLDDRFRLLTGGGRGAIERHQTLRAAIDWSHAMLTDDEKRIFRRVSVFTGGFSLEAALSVCGDEQPLDEYELLELLTRLADKSIIQVDDSDPNQSRFRLLESMRQYAREKSDEAGDSRPSRDRMLNYFLDLAERAEPNLVGAEQAVWLNRLALVEDDLLGALDWSKSLPDGGETGLRLAGAMWRFWEIRGSFSVGIAILNDLLKLAGAGPEVENPPAKECIGKGLNAAGALAVTCGQHAQARKLLDRAVQIRRALNDTRGLGQSLNTLGLCDWRLGDYAGARAHFDEALKLRQQCGDELGAAATRNNLGLIASEQGDFVSARARFDEALLHNRKVGNRAWVAAILNNLAQATIAVGEFEQARRHFAEALEINRQLGNRAWMATSLAGLGECDLRTGKPQPARALFEQSLSINREIGDHYDIAETLIGLSGCARALGDSALARQSLYEALKSFSELRSRSGISRALEPAGVMLSTDLSTAEAGAWVLGAAQALRASLSGMLAPVDMGTRQDAQSECARLIGAEKFQRVFEEGAAVAESAKPWETVVNRCLELLAPPSTT